MSKGSESNWPIFVREPLAALLQALQERVTGNGGVDALHPLLLLLLSLGLDAIVGMVAHHHTPIRHCLAGLDGGPTNLLT